MTLTDILLLLLTCSIFYAAYILRRRMKQMDEFREKMEEAQKENEQPPVMFERPMAVLSVRPPSNKELNPRVLALEGELDKLYAERESGVSTLPNDLWEKKEKELISQMVDIFIRDADHQFLHQTKTRTSGSK